MWRFWFVLDAGLTRRFVFVRSAVLLSLLLSGFGLTMRLGCVYSLVDSVRVRRKEADDEQA